MRILRQETVSLGRRVTVILQLYETEDRRWPYATLLIDPETAEEIWKRRFATLDAATTDFIRRLAEYQ